MSFAEPDFAAPPPVQRAKRRAIAEGDIACIPALALTSLREAIATHCKHADQVSIDAARIAITAYASGALLLAMAALVESGAKVLRPDPT